MSEEINLEGIKKFWPKDAPDVTNVPKYIKKYKKNLIVIKYGGNEYVGIIQNMDNNLASMYNFENIKDISDKKEFLEIGEEWWWGTNRMIPINIIFKSNFETVRKRKSRGGSS